MTDQKINVNQVSPVAAFNHSFDVGIAIKFGMEAAVIYNQILYWLIHNRIHGTNFHKGRTWTYNTPEAMQEFIPYLTHRQIRNGLDKLVAGKVLLKDNFHKNKLNRTSWYALADEKPIQHSKRVYDLPNSVNAIPKVETESQDEDFKKKKCIYQNREMDLPNSVNDHNTYTIHTITSNTLPIIPQNAAANAGDGVEKSSQNKIKPSKKPDKPKPEDISQAAKDFLPLFVEAIRTGRPKYVLKNELAILFSIDEMLKDGRTPEQILKVLKWAVNDKTIRGTWTGWANKIMCKNPAAYLNERFEQLETASEAKEIRKFAPCGDLEESMRKWEEAEKNAI